MKNTSLFEKGFDPGTKPSVGQANKGEICKLGCFLFKEKNYYYPLTPLPLVPIQTLGLNWNISLSRASSQSDIIGWGHNLLGDEQWII